VSAPTYPFAKDRHWVREAPARAASLQAASTQPLHPLIGYNASTLTEVSFRSWLSDRAYYAQEHQVHGQKLFPGSGFIEMACIAGSIVGGAKVRKVQDIVWAQPLSLEQGGQTAQITLMPLGTDEAEYVITSRTEDDEVVVHSEGKVCFQTGGKEPAAHEETLDIRSLKQACTQSLDPQAFYALTRQYGFDYGPAFQTISQLHLSEAYALSRLELAEHVRADFEHYILHPCLVDGALQTVSALVGTLEKTTPYIPFAIGEVEIVRAIPECCWVHVERADGNRPQSADVLKFNVRIVTEGGHDVVRIKDFCVRAFAGAMAHGKEALRQSA
jgi:acyl transferase domain-containing protein